MGRSRSAKGRFAKFDSVSCAANARAQKRKRYESEDSSVTTGCLSVSPGDEPPAKSMKKFPCEGRRAVHLPSLAAALSCCKNPDCGKPLVLADCVSEKKYGLASLLSIPCSHCEYVNAVATDTHVETADQKRGPRPFSSNRKAALGKIISEMFFLCRTRLSSG